MIFGERPQTRTLTQLAPHRIARPRRHGDQPQAQPQAYLSRDALKEALKSRITEKIREKLKTLNQPQIQENESQGAASRNILFASKSEGSAAGKAFLNDSYVAAARRYSNSKRKSIEQIEQQRVAIDLTTDSPTPPPVKTRKVAETTGRQQQQKAENLDKIIGSLRDENFRSAIQEDKDYLQKQFSETPQGVFLKCNIYAKTCKNK